MLLNEGTLLSTSKVRLIPYCKQHVLIYHKWMQDEDIQQATASEKLTLDEEYAMQKSWRQDLDKLTFIICEPAIDTDKTQTLVPGSDDDDTMIGDVNMFLTNDDETAANVVGELELMVATKAQQGQGYGRSALLTFLRYVADHEKDIVAQFTPKSCNSSESPQISYLCAKIAQQNYRSVSLFESVGFIKTSTKPSYFGEFELRRPPFSSVEIQDLFDKFQIEEYSESSYGDIRR